MQCGDLHVIVSALDSESSSPGSSPDWGHCVVLLGKTLFLYPDTQMSTNKFNAGGNPTMN